MFRIILTLSAILGMTSIVFAENVPITGTVESKCSVSTEVEPAHSTVSLKLGLEEKLDGTVILAR